MKLDYLLINTYKDKESGLSGMVFTILLASFVAGILNYNRPVVQKSAAVSAEIRNDIVTFRRMIKNGMSCPMSLPVNPKKNCRDKQAIDIKSENGNVMISSNNGKGSVFGKWHLRAKCVTNPVQKVVIEASLRSKRGKLIKNPLNGSQVNWTDIFSSRIYRSHKRS